MCRDNNHGGRRCPHDTSEARRLRRNNAAMKQMFNASRRTPITPAPVAELPVNSSPTVESIKAQSEKLEQLKNLETQFMSQDFNSEGYQLEIDGEKFFAATKTAGLEKIRAVQEQKVVEIGDNITQLADERTGFTDKQMEERAQAFHKEYLAEVDSMAEELVKVSVEADKLVPIIQAPAARKIAAYLKEFPEDAEALDLQQREKDVTARANKLKDEAELTLHYGSPGVQDMLKARSAAYLEILNEIRPMGGEIKKSDLSQKAKSAVLDAAAHVYPKAWIEASNNGPELVVETNNKRAVYHQNLGRVTKTKYQEVTVETTEPGYVPENNHFEHGWIKVEGDSFYDPYAKITRPVQPASPGKERWIAPRWEFYNSFDHRMNNGKPVGTGWEKAMVGEMVTDPDTGDYKYELVERWRKPKLLVDNLKTYGKSSLQIDKKPTIHDAPLGYPSAVHEFAHRIEHTGPKFLQNMQQQFTKRRTTDAEGVQEKLTPIYRGKKEYGRSDNFIHHYMGKRYEESDQHFEILSTGAEGVFTGRFGGLAGVGDHKPDADMKNFILGLWATA